jgi:plasmid stabilization system protein ParE
LIAYTPRATRQVDALIQHFEEHQRSGAVHALLAALDEAEQKIEHNPTGGLAAPRPYPHLARQGRAWVKAGRYWIAYDTTLPPTIVAVFYETAGIPRRA